MQGDPDDVARVEVEEQLEPTAEVRLLINLTCEGLLTAGKRSGVDRHRSLSADLEHILPSPVEVEPGAEVEVTDVLMLHRDPGRDPAAFFDDEVVRHVHEKHEVVRQP
ncbi:MAG: hypothetical protein JRJ24_20065 [Deltaproteobacteria bacterium]|nr:hypothetical protein [Deltaproteobacteria bacterium]